MNRTRAELRHQRERIIASRRRQFARWCADYTFGAEPPLEVREREFWTPQRVGKFAKWNGVCSCWMCRDVSDSGRRAKLERARQAEMA